MSSQRVRKFGFVLDFTATWAANVLTVVTVGNHNLATGDRVHLAGNNSPQVFNGTVTVTNATTFTVAADITYQYFTAGKATITQFNTGYTGRITITAPRGTALAAVIQSFIAGTGGASYTVDGSLDGVHFTNIATVTHTSNDVQFAQVAPAWAYISINITSVGAATKLEVMYSA